MRDSDEVWKYKRIHPNADHAGNIATCGAMLLRLQLLLQIPFKYKYDPFMIHIFMML